MHDSVCDAISYCQTRNNGVRDIRFVFQLTRLVTHFVLDRKMFGMDYDGIEDAVAKLIGEKKISGRINSQDKILKANSEPNYRLESLRKAEELGSTYLSNLQSTLLRTYNIY